MRFSDLFVRGAIVSLHVSLWRARARNEPPDLDIPDSGKIRAALSFGSWRLADPIYFDKIHTEVRNAERAIEANSLPFPTIPGARYVPDDRIEALAVELKDRREGFGQGVEEFCRQYEEIQKRQVPLLRAALMEALHGDESKADESLRRIISQYPSVEEVRRRFSLRWNVYTLQSVDRGALAALSEEGTEVKSILRGMVEGLRADVQGKLANIMAILQKGGKLQERTINSALGILDRVDQLNVLGDTALTEQISKMRNILKDVLPGEEVKTTVVEGLTDVEAGLKADVEKAMEEAEEALTGLGRRKLDVA